MIYAVSFMGYEEDKCLHVMEQISQGECPLAYMDVLNVYVLEKIVAGNLLSWDEVRAYGVPVYLGAGGGSIIAFTEDMQWVEISFAARLALPSRFLLGTLGNGVGSLCDVSIQCSYDNRTRDSLFRKALREIMEVVRMSVYPGRIYSTDFLVYDITSEVPRVVWRGAHGASKRDVFSRNDMRCLLEGISGLYNITHCPNGSSDKLSYRVLSVSIGRMSVNDVKKLSVRTHNGNVFILCHKDSNVTVDIVLK